MLLNYFFCNSWFRRLSQMKAQESIPKKYLFSYSYKSIISISLAKVSDKKVVYPFVSSLPFSKF